MIQKMAQTKNKGDYGFRTKKRCVFRMLSSFSNKFKKKQIISKTRYFSFTMISQLSSYSTFFRTLTVSEILMMRVEFGTPYKYKLLEERLDE